MNPDLVFSVSEFVALVNQTFEYAFNQVVITGELANYRISKNKWVYFDLKDDDASVRFFGTVYVLPGPLEDGMLLEVRGNPRLHPQFGFSVNVQAIRPVGEGSIKKAAGLLEAKLRKEGVFDESRKRVLPYPPATIGLITSKESAAYADFIKILNHRWRGLEIRHIDVQVQGEPAAAQIAGAIERFDLSADQPEVLVLIRGGGSADDLQAFSTEQVTRAVASSRIPIIAAIGHETDVSLAELAADVRASTPSNAAELLVPDRRDVRRQLRLLAEDLRTQILRTLTNSRDDVRTAALDLSKTIDERIKTTRESIAVQRRLVRAFDPDAQLRRGYVIARSPSGDIIKSGALLRQGDIVNLRFSDAHASAEITKAAALSDSHHHDGKNI